MAVASKLADGPSPGPVCIPFRNFQCTNCQILHSYIVLTRDQHIYPPLKALQWAPLDNCAIIHEAAV